MDMDKYKRDYKFKSSEDGGFNKWIIILGGAVVATLAYFFS